jgi:hypothetical protein
MRRWFATVCLAVPAISIGFPSFAQQEVPARNLVKQGYSLTNIFPGFLTFQKGNSLYICVPTAGAVTNTATLAAKTVAAAGCAEVN